MQIPIFIVLPLGLLAVSTASIFVRMVPDLPAVTIAFWRMAIASAILWAVTAPRRPTGLSSANRGRVIIAGILLGLHFACFFGALKYTSIANATILSTMAPVFTAIIERFALGRTWSKTILCGLIAAIGGAVIIQGGHLGLGHASTTGNLLGLAASVFIAGVLLLTEQIRKDSAALVFSRSLYLVGALTMLLMAGFSGQSLLPAAKGDFLWLVLLGVIPTVFGHTSFYYAVKFVSPTVVAAVPLGEPIVASTLGWYLLQENVPGLTVVGGALTLAGLFLIIYQSRRIQPN
ncbi:MAG: DMT family transporter [Candidatus Marinimicrobia bacterium]|nr:DMT family transporter [Candidatus Neomarinimicrobiota bacterium]